MLRGCWPAPRVPEVEAVEAGAVAARRVGVGEDGAMGPEEVVAWDLARVLEIPVTRITLPRELVEEGETVLAVVLKVDPDPDPVLVVEMVLVRVARHQPLLMVTPTLMVRVGAVVEVVVQMGQADLEPEMVLAKEKVRVA
ncbi:hypothetical protein ZWY2020_009293 [Hordeum vulgare]|nr:hypothetical protein ZWY2020_009293 [Hordeum vulgare]